MPRVYKILSEVGQRRFVYRKLSEVGHRTNGKRISEGWDRKWIADGLQADSKQKAIGSETNCKRMAEGQMFGKGKILRRIFLQRHHNSLEIISVIDEKKLFFKINLLFYHNFIILLITEPHINHITTM